MHSKHILFALLIILPLTACESSPQEEVEELDNKVQALEIKKAPAKQAEPSVVQKAAEKIAGVKMSDGWIRLYEKDNFEGRRVTLPFKRNIMNMDQAKFNDKASSVQFQVPDGWKVILYKDRQFKSALQTLRGKGNYKRLNATNDQVSSVRWVQN